MKRHLFLLIVVLFWLSACDRHGKNRMHINTSGLQPESVSIGQYGRALFSIDTNDLQAGLKRLQPDFMHFLDADLDDPENIRQIREFVSDTFLIRLNRESRHVFGDMGKLKEELTHAFRRFHYHFPDEPIPAVYTYVSGVHYEMPVMYADQIAVIALDCYLGADFPYYRRLGIPMYMIERMSPDHLVNDLFNTLYEVSIMPSATALTVLDEMIISGKRLYFQEAMQPNLADHLIIGYNPEQLAWVERNEARLWAFLIGEEKLFSSDLNDFNRLFRDGPFSHDFSREAPARLGEWVGWQIVRKYMKKHTEVSLADLIGLTDSQQILNDSGYRPR